MIIVFSDLDGTLLDPQSYSWDSARPALDALAQQGIPLVFCTSKTRAEVEFWRRELDVSGPFIVENGGAVYIPPGCFRFPIPGSIERDGYRVIEFGDSYRQLVRALDHASREAGRRVLGFHSMNVAEISVRTCLPVRQAQLAMQREYDEPFVIIDHGARPLLAAIEAQGKKWTRGGRFYHIMGRNDKATAVRALTALYRSIYGQVVSIGLGDGWNDVGFLRTVDIPVLVRTDAADQVRRQIPRSMVTELPGASGWNDALLSLLASHS